MAAAIILNLLQVAISNIFTYLHFHNHSILPHVLYMCTRIKIFRYTSLQGATKNCQVRTCGTKRARQGQRLCAPIATESLLSRFEGFL